MWKKSLTVLLLLFFMQAGQAQLDRYKYIVVPLQFEGFKKVNQYRSSTLIKLLFTREGFNAVYDNEIPVELATRPCLGLKVRIVDTSTLLRTKVKLALEDCYGQVVYETPEGASKIKDYEPAYRAAIEGAFSHFEEVEYSYQPSEEADTEMAVPAVSAARPEAEIPPASEALPAEVVVSPVPAAVPEKAGEETAMAEPELWYAQPTENGYQLVDSAPKVRMKLVNTSQEDTYIAVVDGTPRGTVFKREGQWWHEYYEDGTSRMQKLRIKF